MKNHPDHLLHQTQEGDTIPLSNGTYGVIVRQEAFWQLIQYRDDRGVTKTGWHYNSDAFLKRKPKE